MSSVMADVSGTAAALGFTDSSSFEMNSFECRIAATRSQNDRFRKGTSSSPWFYM